MDNIFRITRKNQKILQLGLMNICGKSLNDVHSGSTLSRIYKYTPLGSNKFKIKTNFIEIAKGILYSNFSDIWSLGCVYYCMLTGHHPFENGSIAQISALIELGKYSPLPNTIDNELKLLIEKMLNPDYEKRPSINEILQVKLIKEEIRQFSIDQDYPDLMKIIYYE